MVNRIDKNRNQFGLFDTQIKDLIEPGNLVRVMDALVGNIDLVQLGFEHVRELKTGASPCEPALPKIMGLNSDIGRTRFPGFKVGGIRLDLDN